MKLKAGLGASLNKYENLAPSGIRTTPLSARSEFPYWICHLNHHIGDLDFAMKIA
jgi:hypothetical protein